MEAVMQRRQPVPTRPPPPLRTCCRVGGAALQAAGLSAFSVVSDTIHTCRNDDSNVPPPTASMQRNTNAGSPVRSLPANHRRRITLRCEATGSVG